MSCRFKFNNTVTEIEYTNRYSDLPIEGWKYLTFEKRDSTLYAKYECERILKSIREAKELEVWKHIDHTERTTGNTRPYKDLDDFVLNGLGITKRQLDCIEQLYLSFNPDKEITYRDTSNNDVTVNLPVTPICAVCNTEFTPKRTDSKYCSSACRQKAYRQRLAE